MSSPILDFGRVVGRILRGLRYVSFGFIGVMVVLLAFRVADVYTVVARVHPLLGIAFLLALGLLLAWLVGRPLYRYFKVPAVLKPPKLPSMGERTPRHLVRHLAFVERYLEALPRNAEWSGTREQVAVAVTACRALRVEAAAAKDTEGWSARLDRFERETVTPLLAPLDRKAADTIRSEALRVGLATAVSPYGTLDAFLVLWRSANLVSRIATIYYGRPGARGTLQILRDVSMATIAGAYLDDLGEVAGDLVGALAGKTAGFFAGPLMEGCLNAVGTMRIGYVAKHRCRAFQAWTPRTASRAARDALGEAAQFTSGLVGDLVRSVGGGVLRLTGKALHGVVERVSALFRAPVPEQAGGA